MSGADDVWRDHRRNFNRLFGTRVLMQKFYLVFVLIRSMSAHKFGILWVSEQTPQSIDHRKVPQHQSRNLFLHIIVYFFFLLVGFELLF